MVFNVHVQDALSSQPVSNAVVMVNAYSQQSYNQPMALNPFCRYTDGSGNSNFYNGSAPINPGPRMVDITINAAGYAPWCSVSPYELNDTDLNISVSLTPSFKWPSKDIIRNFRGNFGGIVIPELQYGFANKVLFTPGYVVESDSVREIIRQRYKDAGLLHFPINLYNTSPIYHDVYPPWDDTLINKYLEELLSSGLIPVGSAFADNVKTVKPVVNPYLVPAVFTGWENPTPIVRPDLDSDNLFFVAKQYFPKSLVYWHNPSGQGAPYVNNADWGLAPDQDPNATVWQYMVNESNCAGLLSQGNGWENSGNDSVNRLDDFVYRLIQGHNGWPVCDLVDFEEVVYYNTTMQGNPLLTGEFIRDRVPQLTGYCNG